MQATAMRDQPLTWTEGVDVCSTFYSSVIVIPSLSFPLLFIVCLVLPPELASVCKNREEVFQNIRPGPCFKESNSAFFLFFYIFLISYFWVHKSGMFGWQSRVAAKTAKWETNYGHLSEEEL